MFGDILSRVSRYPRIVDGASRVRVAADLAALKKALRRERARARARHWTYDTTRHLALATAVRRHAAALVDFYERSAPEEEEAMGVSVNFHHPARPTFTIRRSSDGDVYSFLTIPSSEGDSVAIFFDEHETRTVALRVAEAWGAPIYGRSALNDARELATSE